MGAVGESRAMAYAATDSAPALFPFALLVVRVQAPRCTSGTKEADLTAAVRKVLTNTSAIVP